MTFTTEPSMSEIPQALTILNNISVLSEVVATEVDACGLACPLPLLKAKQALRELVTNDVMRVLATDAGSLKDFVSFAQITGHLLQGFYQQNEIYYYLIRKQ
jgi:tRNA 2-thiouridine synthesizing protein A